MAFSDASSDGTLAAGARKVNKMAMSTPLVTVAAAVAAVGALCGYESRHAVRHVSVRSPFICDDAQDYGAQSRERFIEGKREVKEKSRESQGREKRNPVFAPQFDGLHCYETLVRR